MTDHVPDGTNHRFDFAAPLPSLSDLRAAHLIAIGGSGMSGVARLLLAAGVRVSGSDRGDSPVLQELHAAGAEVWVGQTAEGAQRVPDDAVVIVSSAIAEDNPELAAIRSRGLTVLHRAQALSVLMAGRAALAVAGANGKTTTSAMATVALRAAGADPSFAIGAPIAGIGANSGVGQGDSFVVEADESDGSFVVYRPQVAIVTSVRDDHLDFYGTSERLQQAYAEFADTIRDGGLLVACADDPGAAALAIRHRELGRRVVTYGRTADADLRLADESGTGFDWSGTLLPADGGRIPLRLKVPGAHNLQNATGVVLALTAGFGLSLERAAEGVGEFTGSARRLEPRGEAGGVRVIDDYAHNPDKLDAAVRAGLGLRDGGRLVAVFQPHLFSRTQHAAAGLAAALSLADVAVVLDVYPAREAPVPGVTGALVADRVTDAEVVYAPTLDEAFQAVVDRARPGDLVLTLGAGDVTTLGARILQALQD
ncbi:UDP-N-acetylmuramate--L-alanine ligase [Flexivirga endophytica]|uniref:UDP-N-acetylmuramate--L-alanine ligase n=1 Tax=Flexivirga endophytica TaxID=1849103 RepID=A0A916SX19_9MICO|nr:UDP-N-acetylmuramate--L-alanine ligase [Flexivirga endophytica]GGB18193.1 UDP-N-acetylmuramate--L-alanine ligase [Flexivirga endophytica]GHB37422.1 UDP-N-acetylmuramate--L-alanine ligase [Flexivirga endophytica]